MTTRAKEPTKCVKRMSVICGPCLRSAGNERTTQYPFTAWNASYAANNATTRKKQRHDHTNRIRGISPDHAGIP